MKANIYKLRFVIPILLVLSVFIVYVYSINGGILVFHGDSYEQIYHFYVGGYEKLSQGNLLAFDFSQGLGANPLYNTYYFLFSPFFYLSCIFGKQNMEYSFLWINALKLGLMYFFCVIWLKKISKNDFFIIVGSLLFTFSGWTFFYMHYVLFLDHIIILPLLLYFTEKYLFQNKPLGLVLTVAYLAIANYYFLYLFIPFICLYALYRVLILEENNFINLVLRALRYLGWLLLGMGIGAIILIPNIQILLGNPRLAADKDMSMMSKYEYFKVFSSFFTPVVSRLDANYFIESKWYRFLGWGNGNGIYMGVFTMLSTFLFFFTKKSREKTILVAFYGLGVLFFTFPIFSYLLQGSMETRWFFYFNILNILAMKIVIDEINANLMKSRTIVLVSALVGTTIVFLLGLSKYFGLSNHDNFLNLVKIELVVLLFIAAYLTLLILKRKQWLIGFLVVLEILFSSYVFLNNNYILDSTYFKEEFLENKSYQTLDDGSFYRVRQDNYSYWPSNSAFAKGIRGLSFYHSIYNSEMENYLRRFMDTWSMPEKPGQELAYSLLSPKYWVSTVYSHRPPACYSFLKTTGNKDFFVNDCFIELGFGYDKTISEDAIKNLDYLTQDLVMQEYLVTQSSTNSEYTLNQDLELIGTYPIENETEFNLVLNDEIILINNRYFADLRYELYGEGMLIDELNYYEMSYYVLFIDEGTFVDRIKVTNVSPYKGLIDIYQVPRNYFEEKYSERVSSSFYNTKVSSNYIQGQIKLSQDMTVFTSVPYDKGWSIYVDGVEIKYEKVNMGFIGFPLPAGEYTVEFKYEMPFIKVGASVSVCSGLLLFFILRRRRTGND